MTAEQPITCADCGRGKGDGAAGCKRPRHEGDVCLSCLLKRLGVTYRQLDYWATAGLLHPVGGVGNGSVRDWPDGEIEIAGRMARLVSAGIPLRLAAAFARDSWPRAEIAPGVVLEVTG